MDYLDSTRMQIATKRKKALKELENLAKTDRYGMGIPDYLIIRTRERRLNRFLEETK